MLIRDDGAHWTAIAQPAHAWLSGQVARHWGNDRFAPPTPREEVCLAAEQHDVAWIDWDLRPPLEPAAGRAASFLEAPFAGRQAIWHGAPDRLLAQSPYAALLVSVHGRNIHTRFGNPADLPPERAAAVADYLDEQRARQAELIAALGVAPDEVERAGDLVFALDALSLRVCHGWPPGDLPPVDGVAIHVACGAGGDVRLDPWPLDVPSLDVHVDARTLAERFADEAALHAALAATPWTRLRWTLRPRRSTPAP